MWTNLFGTLSQSALASLKECVRSRKEDILRTGELNEDGEYEEVQPKTKRQKYDDADSAFNPKLDATWKKGLGTTLRYLS